MTSRLRIPDPRLVRGGVGARGGAPGAARLSFCASLRAAHGVSDDADLPARCSPRRLPARVPDFLVGTARPEKTEMSKRRPYGLLGSTATTGAARYPTVSTDDGPSRICSRAPRVPRGRARAYGAAGLRARERCLRNSLPIIARPSEATTRRAGFSPVDSKNAPRSPSRHNTTVPSPWALKSRASPPGTGSPSPSPARPSPRTTWVRAGPTRPRRPRNLPIFATRALWRFLPPDSRDREDGRRTRGSPVPPLGERVYARIKAHDSPSDPTPHPHPRSVSPVHQARSRTGASLTAPATKVAPSSLSSASAR